MSSPKCNCFYSLHLGEDTMTIKIMSLPSPILSTIFLSVFEKKGGSRWGVFGRQSGKGHGIYIDTDCLKMSSGFSPCSLPFLPVLSAVLSAAGQGSCKDH